MRTNSPQLAIDMTSQPTTNYWRKINAGGREREYLLHIPAIAPLRGAAVLLAFHGSASSAAHLVEFSGLAEVSDEKGFIVVFPQGLGPDRLRRTWNAGGCCGWAFKEDIDDVAFAAAILDDLEQDLQIDSSNVYATGMSNGGMMAYRLAAELPERFSAVASVAGPMGKLVTAPKKPVSICHFHGTLDEYAPYAGGVGKRSSSKSDFLSAEATVEIWRKANDCSAEFVEEALPTFVSDGTGVTRRTWIGGRQGKKVTLYTIDGMGHTWPGRKTRLTHLGPMTANLCASRAMWDFFLSSSNSREA
jgi:polyhydroxybutyrate depolymerase